MKIHHFGQAISSFSRTRSIDLIRDDAIDTGENFWLASKKDLKTALAGGSSCVSIKIVRVSVETSHPLLSHSSHLLVQQCVSRC